MPEVVTSEPAPTPGAVTPASRAWPRLWEHALAFVLGACAVLVAQSAWKLTRPPEPLASVPGGVDLNTADVGTLRQLPGVGPHLAARIVDHRTKQGPFASVEDLRSVQGIGPATLERLRPALHVPSESAAPSAPGSSKQTSPKASPGETLDLNTATREQLLRLPGIGPTLADRILQERDANGAYRSVNDLARVRGIKAKTIEKLAPFVKVAETPRPTT